MRTRAGSCSQGQGGELRRFLRRALLLGLVVVGGVAGASAAGASNGPELNSSRYVGTVPFDAELRIDEAPVGTASYRWDFDGNGSVDATTAGPTTSHTYTTDGMVQPRAWPVDGGGQPLASLKSDLPLAPVNLDALMAAGGTGRIQTGGGDVDFTMVIVRVPLPWGSRMMLGYGQASNTNPGGDFRDGWFLVLSSENTVSKVGDETQNRATGSAFGGWKSVSGGPKLGAVQWSLDDQTLFGFVGGSNPDNVTLTFGNTVVSGPVVQGDALVLPPATPTARTVLEVIDRLSDFLANLSNLDQLVAEKGLSLEPVIQDGFVDDVVGVFTGLAAKLPKLVYSMMLGKDEFADALDDLDTTSGAVSVTVDNPVVGYTNGPTPSIDVGFDLDATAVLNDGSVQIPLLKGEKVGFDVPIEASLTGPLSFGLKLPPSQVPEFVLRRDTSKLIFEAGLTQPVSQAGVVRVPPLTVDYDITNADAHICVPVLFGGQSGGDVGVDADVVDDATWQMGGCDDPGRPNDVDIDMEVSATVLNQPVVAGHCGLKIASLGTLFQPDGSGDPPLGAMFNSILGGCGLDEFSPGAGLAAVLLELLQFDPQQLISLAGGIADTVQKATERSDFTIPLSGKKISESLGFLEDFRGWVESQQDGVMLCGAIPGEIPSGGLTYDPNTGIADPLYCRIGASIVPGTATIDTQATVMNATYGQIVMTSNDAIGPFDDSDVVYDPGSPGPPPYNPFQPPEGQGGPQNGGPLSYIVVQPQLGAGLNTAQQYKEWWRSWYAKGLRVAWSHQGAPDPEDPQQTPTTVAHITTPRVQTFDELLQMIQDEGLDPGFTYDEATHSIRLPISVDLNPGTVQVGAEGTNEIKDLLGIDKLDLNANANLTIDPGAIKSRFSLGLITLRDTAGITRANGGAGDHFTDRLFLEFDPGRPLFEVSDGSVEADFTAGVQFHLLSATAGPIRTGDPVFRLVAGESSQTREPLIRVGANPAAIDANGIQVSDDAGHNSSITNAALVNDIFDASPSTIQSAFPTACSLGMQLGLKATGSVQALGMPVAQMTATANGYAADMFPTGCELDLGAIALSWSTQQIFGFDNLLVHLIRVALDKALGGIQDLMEAKGLDKKDPVLGIKIADAYKYTSTFRARLGLLEDPGQSYGVVRCERGTTPPSSGDTPHLVVLDPDEVIACRATPPSGTGNVWTDPVWSITGGTVQSAGTETAVFSVQDTEHFQVLFSGRVLGQQVDATYPAVEPVTSTAKIVDALKYIFTINNSRLLDIGLGPDGNLQFRFKWGICTLDRITEACILRRSNPSLDVAFSAFKALSTQQFPLVQLEANPALNASYSLTGDVKGRVLLGQVGNGEDDPNLSVQLSNRTNVTAEALIRGRPTFLAKIAAFAVQIGDPNVDTLKGGVRVRLARSNYPGTTGAETYYGVGDFVNNLAVSFESPQATPDDPNYSYKCSDPVNLQPSGQAVFGGDLCASLPVYFDGQQIGAAAGVNFRIHSFGEFFNKPAPTVNAGGGRIDNTQTQTEYLGPDGQSNLFFYIDPGTIQALLDKLVNFDIYDLIVKILGIVEDFAREQDDKKVPIIGTKFSKVADVTGKIRQKMIDLKPVILTLFGVSDQGFAVAQGCVENVIVDTLGPEGYAKETAGGLSSCYGVFFGRNMTGMNVLKVTNAGLPTTDPRRWVQVTMLCKDLVNPTGPFIACGSSSQAHKYFDVRDVKIHIKLGADGASVEAPPFDVGVAGLGLKASGDYSVRASLNWSSEITMGVNFDKGLYFERPADPNAKLLELSGTVEPPDEIEARLGFLKATMEKLMPTDNVLSLSFSLPYPSGSTGAQYFIQDLPRLVDGITPSFSADARLKYHIDTTVNASSGVAAEFPRLDTTLDLVFTNIGQGWNGDDHLDLVGSQLYIGEYVTRMLKPAATDMYNRFNDYVTPFLTTMNSQVPVLSAVSQFTGGAAFTWKAALASQCSTCAMLIDKLDKGWQFITSLATASGSASIPLGDFRLDGGRLQRADDAVDLENDPGGTTGMTTPVNGNSDAPIDLAGNMSMPPAPPFNDAGFTFPITQKKSNFILVLMKKDVGLVEYSTGWYNAYGYANQWGTSVPLVSVLGATLMLDLGLRLEIKLGGGITAGYDTHGINQLVKEAGGWGNVLNTLSGASAKTLLAGLYLNDRNSSGADVPEARFAIGVGAYGGVSISVVVASIGGGVWVTGGVTIDFDLNENLDTDHDGKLRIVDFSLQNLKCLIQIEPSLYFKVGWYAYIHTILKDWDWEGVIKEWSTPLGSAITLGNCTNVTVPQAIVENSYGGGPLAQVMTTLFYTSIPNRPPDVKISGDTPTLLQRKNDSFTFDPAGSRDPDGAIVSFEYTCYDGAGVVVRSGAQLMDPVTCTYANAGQYTMRVTATDDGDHAIFNGGQTAAVQTTTVERSVYVFGLDLKYGLNAGAVSNVWTDPLSTTEGSTVKAALISQPGGSLLDIEEAVPVLPGGGETSGGPEVQTGERVTPTITCQWRFGDGTITMTSGCGSALAPVSRLYTSPGVYNFAVDVIPPSRVGRLTIARSVFVSGAPVPKIDTATTYVNVASGPQSVDFNGANSYSGGPTGAEPVDGYCWYPIATPNPPPGGGGGGEGGGGGTAGLPGGGGVGVPNDPHFDPATNGTASCMSQAATFSYTMSTAGTYQIRLWVHNPNGWSTFAEHTMRALKSSLVVAPDVGAAPLSTLADAGLAEPAAGDPLMMCVFDWGDGTRTYTYNITLFPFAFNPITTCGDKTHSYAAGKYEFHLYLATQSTFALFFGGESPLSQDHTITSVDAPTIRLAVRHGNVPPGTGGGGGGGGGGEGGGGGTAAIGPGGPPPAPMPQQPPIPALLDATASEAAVAPGPNDLTATWTTWNGTRTAVNGNPLLQSVSYSAMGNYPYSLSLTDSYGSQTVENDWVRVGSIGFTMSPWNASGYLGLAPLALSLNATTSAFQPMVQGEQFLSCTMDFGDGSALVTQTSPAQGCGSFAKIYAKPGNYKVRLTAYVGTPGGGGQTATSVIRAPLPNQPNVTAVFSTESHVRVGAVPTAVAHVRHANLDGDGIARLDASPSGDADGEIVAYHWTDMDLPASSWNASGTQVSVPFGSAGTRRFSLSVTDDDGNTTQTNNIIVVAGNLTAPATGFDTRDVAAVGDTVTVTPTGSMPLFNFGDVVECRLDWGDGTVTAYGGCGGALSHTYAARGPYTVKTRIRVRQVTAFPVPEAAERALEVTRLVLVD